MAYPTKMGSYLSLYGLALTKEITRPRARYPAGSTPDPSYRRTLHVMNSTLRFVLKAMSQYIAT
jgi:hypothetical protein